MHFYIAIYYKPGKFLVVNLCGSRWLNPGHQSLQSFPHQRAIVTHQETIPTTDTNQLMMCHIHPPMTRVSRASLISGRLSLIRKPFLQEIQINWWYVTATLPWPGSPELPSSAGDCHSSGNHSYKRYKSTDDVSHPPSHDQSLQSFPHQRAIVAHKKPFLQQIQINWWYVTATLPWPGSPELPSSMFNCHSLGNHSYKRYKSTDDMSQPPSHDQGLQSFPHQWAIVTH